MGKMRNKKDVPDNGILEAGREINQGVESKAQLFRSLHG